MIYVDKREILYLYSLLHGQGKDLDMHLYGLMQRLENRIFESLSIEEIEKLDSMKSGEIESLSQKI